MFAQLHSAANPGSYSMIANYIQTGEFAINNPASAHHEGGNGPTLVLLHGLTGVWSIWKPVLGLLERHFRVLALTLPGHDGGSHWESGQPASVAAMADRLADELRARGIERAHIAGNSLGGWLALELARRGLADSVTALSPAGGWQTDAEYMQVARPFRILAAVLPWIHWLLAPLMRFAAMRKRLFAQSMAHGERLTGDEARAFLRGFRRCAVLRGLLAQMRKQGPIETLDCQVPIIIAWAEHDQVIPFNTYGRPLLAAVSGATQAQIDGAGHVPMYDAPEQVVALIRATAAKAQGERPASA